MRPFLTVFWPYIHRYRWLLALGYITSMISAGIALSVGLIINAQLDDVLADLDQLARLAGFAAFVVSIILVHALATFCHSYTMSWVGGHIVRNVRRALFGRVLGHGEQLVDEESSGELQTRIIADTVALGDFLGGQLPNLFVTAVSFVGGLAAATYVSPLMTAAVVGGFAILAIPMLLLLPVLRRRGELTQQAEAETGRVAGEALRNAPVVHAFNQLNREQVLFDTSSGRVTRLFLSMLRLQMAYGTVINAGAWILLAVILLLGARQIAGGTVTFGQLTAFAYYVVFVVNAGVSLVSLATSVNMAIGRTEKIRVLLTMAVPPRMDGALPVTAPARIELEGVGYRYPSRDRDALDGIDLVIEPNTRIAFVGASGSGKSTVFKVLLRLVEPTRGRVLANGTDAHRYDVAAWRGQFGFVPQTEYLVSGTVAENIAYGLADATREAVEQAAREAHAHDFVIALPQGYDTDLGEVGSRLSGGQRQRISLARAILRRPTVYLLDEATSALDAESEYAVEQALDRLAEVSTVVTIAHRLRTVHRANRIVVMADGRIVSEGTHAELDRAEPVYRRLISAYRQ